MSADSIFFYVQHLLGIGHLRRAVTLARGLAAAGLEVTVASGGMPIPIADLGGARLVQLPSVRATDMSFRELIDGEGNPVDDDWRRQRSEVLRAAWEEAKARVLLFELFPFGRWGMRFELLPLLEAAYAAKPRPVIAASVRDILVAKTKPERYDQMVDLAEQYFDHILVHGDPEVIDFYRTLPQARRIAGRVEHTGYVVDESGARGSPGDDGWDEVLVSAGGGRVGHRLLETAIEARRLTTLADLTWRVLVGYHSDTVALHELQRAAAPGVVVEGARSDFPTLLMNCRLSISQGGYNTVMEAMRAGCRVVVSPYAGLEETEQTLRAELLAARGALTLVPEADLSADSLATAVNHAADGPTASAAAINTDGVHATAAAIRGWLR